MDKSILKIDWATQAAAVYACKNWHYSRCMPVGKIVKIGVWENKKYIGCVLFSRGANKSLGNPYNLTQIQVCELTRVALNTHITPVTRIMSIAIKYLKMKCPNIKLIVSFADLSKDHYGGIYQGGNWIYCGKTSSADEYYYRGKLWHGRAFRKVHGSHLKYIDSGLKIVKGSQKFRYLMPLDNATMLLLNKLRQSYPKRNKHAMA